MKNNNWYIYQNDVYGVNGLLTFQNKENLMEYVLSEDFVEISAPDGIKEEDFEKINQLTEKFSLNKITHIEYSDGLLAILTENEGEIEDMHIEDFESLCTGVSEFSIRCIEGFYSDKEVASLPSVPESDKKEFQEYFDTAEENWVG